MTERSPTGTPPELRWAVPLATALLVLLVFVGAVAFYLIESRHLVPPDDAVFVRLALVVGLGGLAVVAIGRVVFTTARRFAGKRHAGLIQDVYRIIAYTALAAAVLYVLGVNGYALLAGGTFAGLVIGLASQTALANLVAGVVLLVARPFLPGDRVTLTTSQFSFLMPVYPPKFYSQDLLVPGFTGTVQDIGLMYTSLRLDDGPTAWFPNSIVLMAAVILHNVDERWVRIKYEVPPSVDPSALMPLVKEAVAADDWVSGKGSVTVLVNQATLTSYVISVDALCVGNLEEPPRSALYLRIMKAVASLSPPHPSGPAQAAPTASPQPPAPPPSPPGGSASASTRL
jgi:small conductance mechanosensitive channel